MTEQFEEFSLVEEAERFVIATALRKGLTPRAEIARPAQARRYLDLGVNHFCIGWDVSILADWFGEQGRAMRAILGGGAAGPAAPLRDTAYPQGGTPARP